MRLTLAEIRARALYQIGAEAGDGEDFAPHLDDSIREGYGLMRLAWGREWPAAELAEGDKPDLPAWAHPALADYAAHMVLRNGGAARQERGVAFYASFRQALSRLAARDGEAVKFTHLFT